MQRSQFHPALETLETRILLAPVVSPDFRTIDGTKNNLAQPSWGSAGIDLLRTAPAAYADNISTPSGAGRANPRLISNTLSDQTDSIPNRRLLSDWIYAWGQFIDHDLDLTSTGSTSFNIPIPAGDLLFDPNDDGLLVMPFKRSNFDPATGNGTDNPRQQTNDITAFLDGSVIYGSDAIRAAALRTFAGGRLRTSAGGLLPFNTSGLPNANDAHLVADDQLFLAGDVRANENVELSAVHTLFVREHNRIAGILSQANPGWTDEEIYQHARQTVSAELQVITYKEFLPALLGPYAVEPYAGYDPNVNPGIANEFSTAAFRVGHTLVNDDVEFFDNDGHAVRDAIELKDAFFNPASLRQVGTDPILKYLATDNAQEIDLKLVDGLRNFLFGPPGAGGFDLAARNIQRGRDHGLADYNTTRQAYGLPAVTGFNQITRNSTLQNQIRDLYGTVDNIDLWVGGLAEDHAAGASVGPTFQRIIARQFERLRDGDRFWYQRIASGDDLAALEQTTLADIIKRNTGITKLQDNVFFFSPGSPVTERMDRAYNPIADYHFFTTSAGEFSIAVANGYRDEMTGQPGFAVLASQLPGTLPIHRMYNPNSGQHYYTLSDGECDFLITAGWRYEKDEGFAYPTPAPGMTEIFRLYNRLSGAHLFTEDASQRDILLTRFGFAWTQHDSLGYAYPVSADGVVRPSQAAGATAAAGAAETVAPARVGDGSAIDQIKKGVGCPEFSFAGPRGSPQPSRSAGKTEFWTPDPGSARRCVVQRAGGAPQDAYEFDDPVASPATLDCVFMLLAAENDTFAADVH